MTQPGTYAAATQPGPPPPLLPQASNAPGSMVLPPPPPFYSQSGNMSANAQAHDGANTDYSRSTSGFMSAISHALNNFGQSHPNYPPSPESSASINSRNSSPRLHYRDAIPYTQRSGSSSGSRQSSLRKGTLDPYHPPAPWDIIQEPGNRSSPAPGSVPGSRSGSVYGGSSKNAAGNNTSNGTATGGAPAFSYPANEFATQSNSSTTAASNQTLVAASEAPSSGAGQSQAAVTRGNDAATRFSLPTGPLSPFSGMGLSSISPYLSAFSNARDTPLVASPGRGVAPGTPTSSLSTNVFDYTMRPPSKPASSATPSKAGNASSSDRAGAASTATHSNGTTASGAAATTGSKRKEAPNASKDDNHLPSASMALSASESSSLPALADFIDDQQRSAANGLLTLLGGGGAETPSRFVRGEGAGGSVSNPSDGRGADAKSRTDAGVSSAMENNPGTTSANPSSNPFFESAVTPGPEAFLLRLQGGEQERRAGLLGAHANGPSNILSNSSSGGHIVPTGNGHLASMGPPSSALGSTGLDTPGFGLFDFNATTGLTSGTPGQSGGVGWLLSPSIQALISSFAPSGSPQAPGEGGSYFPLSRRPSNLGPGTPTLSRQQGATSATLTSVPALTEGSEVSIKNGGASAGNSSAEHEVIGDLEGQSDLNHLGNIALERALDDASNPFFIPKQMFRACYSIPHWELPPLTRLSVLAMHAQQNLLKHVPILHEPTFRIDTTPGCLAFAFCMLGCHEVGRRWWAGEEVVPRRKGASKATAPTTFKANGTNVDVKKENHVDQKPSVENGASNSLLDEEDGQELVKPIVMTEKVDMLMRSFAGRCKSDKDRVSVVQALMLFQTNNFLSSDSTTRAIASISHGSVVSVARKAGLYDPEAKHVAQDIQYTPDQVVRNVVFEESDLCFGYSFLPSYIPGCPDEEKIWRQWAEYEGRRRTAYLIFLLDTVASLDAGLPALIELSELQHLPLPAPDTIWRASSAENFSSALKSYKGLTLGAALEELLRSHTDEEDEERSIAEKSEMDTDVRDGPLDSKASQSANRLIGGHGPFARLLMILPILRGIVHLLQSRAEKAAEKPSPLEAWFTPSAPGSSISNENESEDKQVEFFKRALSRWRKAWDADELCLCASSPVAQAKAEASAKASPNSDEKKPTVSNETPPAFDDASTKKRASTSPPPNEPPRFFTSKTASGATPLCEDALPFYWLSHVLLGHATSKSVPLKRPQTGSAAATASGPEGIARQSDAVEKSASMAGGESSDSGSNVVRRIPDFRSMLRFAKTFVNSGEGTSGSSLTGKIKTGFSSGLSLYPATTA